MVSAGVSFEGKRRLHFVDEKPKLTQNITSIIFYHFSLRTVTHYIVMISFFNKMAIGAPAHSARLTQAWLSANCHGFIDNNSWPPNSPDFNPLDFHVWGAMLEAYNRVNPKPHNIAELKKMLRHLGQIAYRLNTPFSSGCSETLASLC